MSGECQFPLFRAKFLGACAWASPDDEAGPSSADDDAGQAEGAGPSSTRVGPTSGRGGLASLDLRALPREDGPPTELQARREKFAFFEKHCSEVAEGLCLGSDAVARSREILKASRITHVINCVGFLYPAYFKDEMKYVVLYLQDTPAEDITSVLYDVFDFIEAARSSGGRVLCHCSQGVSRSATLIIAYLMWKLDQSFEDVFQSVKAIRGVANPNIGFTCQLLNWHKRRKMPLDGCRVYRIAPQCSAAPTYLVPKSCSVSGLHALDSRGAFVIHLPEKVFIWQGSRCPHAFVAAAERAASALHRYERAPGPAVLVQEGSEPAELASGLALGTSRPPSQGSVGERRDSESGPAGPLERSSLSNLGTERGDSWDRDYQLYEAAVAAAQPGTTSGLGGRSRSGSAGPSPRGPGRAPKTPRSETAGNDGAAGPSASGTAGGAIGPASPNGRARKHRRSNSQRSSSPTVDAAAAEVSRISVENSLRQSSFSSLQPATAHMAVS